MIALQVYISNNVVKFRKHHIASNIAALSQAVHFLNGVFVYCVKLFLNHDTARCRGGQNLGDTIAAQTNFAEIPVEAHQPTK